MLDPTKAVPATAQAVIRELLLQPELTKPNKTSEVDKSWGHFTSPAKDWLPAECETVHLQVLKPKAGSHSLELVKAPDRQHGHVRQPDMAMLTASCAKLMGTQHMVNRRRCVLFRATQSVVFVGPSPFRLAARQKNELSVFETVLYMYLWVVVAKSVPHSCRVLAARSFLPVLGTFIPPGTQAIPLEVATPCLFSLNTQTLSLDSLLRFSVTCTACHLPCW
jgi:hypothetical protein